MSNTLEFVLKMRDLMSSGMVRAAQTARQSMERVQTAASQTQQRISQTAQRASATVQRVASQTQRQISQLARPTRVAIDSSQIREAGREVQQVRDRLGRLRDERGRFVNGGGGSRPVGGSRPGGGGGMFGGFGGMLAGVGLMAGAGSIVNAGMQAQAQKASFEVMAGQKEGGKLYGDLTKFAQDSIFGNEVYQNAQTMKAFGVETSRVMPTIKMLGDISMGNKDRLGSLSLAYSQIMSTGRLMGQDLLQLVNAGFNPLKIISEKTGMSMIDLKSKMEKGAISADMVRVAFETATGPGGQFFGMTDKIAKTDFGKLEALKGQVSGLATQFGGVAAPIIGAFITNTLAPLATWIGKNQEGILTYGGALLAGVATFKAITFATKTYKLITGLLTVSTRAQTVAQLGLNVAVLTNPITWILVGVAAAAVWAYQKFETFRGAVHGVLEVFSNLAGILGDAFTGNFSSAGSKIASAWNKGFDSQIKKAPELADQINKGLRAEDVAKKFEESGIKNGMAYLEGFAKVAQKGLEIADAMFMGPGLAGFAGKKMADKYFGRDKDATTKPAGKPVNAFANFSELGKTDKLKDSSNRVAGGGLRAINITVHKFFDSNNIYVSKLESGIEETGDKVAENLLRILHSAGMQAAY